MRKLVPAAVATGVFAVAVSSASAASYYVARAQPHDAKISFRVKHGTVDAGFTYTKDVTCHDGRHYDTAAAAWDSTEVGDNGRFKVLYRQPKKHGRQLLAGKINGETATGRTRIKTQDRCDTGRIRWDAKRVSRARWQKFNLPHFHP